MKKFQFKLNGLLKVREFKEKKIKFELGMILKEIGEIKEQISFAASAIDETYDAQEAFIKDSATGLEIRFFPYFIEGKKDDIKNKENMLWALEKKYEAKIEELAIARGQVKVMEKFKDKKHDEWRRQKNRKDQEEIEENIMMKNNGDSLPI